MEGPNLPTFADLKRHLSEEPLYLQVLENYLRNTAQIVCLFLILNLFMVIIFGSDCCLPSLLLLLLAKRFGRFYSESEKLLEATYSMQGFSVLF